MAVGRWGYVGAVLTTGGVNLAAAVDRQVLKSQGAESAVAALACRQWDDALVLRWQTGWGNRLRRRLGGVAQWPLSRAARRSVVTWSACLARALGRPRPSCGGSTDRAA
jgi:hypothetical protein